MSGFEALLAGRTLGERYRVDALIGRGGMGAVYRAADLRLGRAVAVKVLSPSAALAPEARRALRSRFGREARAAAGLRHPNVVVIHDSGTDAALDLDFLVMELLHGEDLAQRLARGWVPAPGEAVAVLRGSARGLAAGHRAGLVHRDVKPGNLFLCADEAGDGSDGGVRVLDFGIAQMACDPEGTVTQLTQWGGGPLSPAYASPEQLRGAPVLSAASDVYGLGAIAYQLLAGRRPRDEDAVRRIVAGQTVDGPERLEPGPALPAPLAELVMRALSPDPAARPADAAAFLAELEQVAAEMGPTAFVSAAVPVPVELAPSAEADGGEEADERAADAGVVTEIVPAAGAGPVDASEVSSPTVPEACGGCGAAPGARAKFCPECGMALVGTVPRRRRPFAGLAGRRRSRVPALAAAAVLVLGVVGAAAAALPGPLALPFAAARGQAAVPAAPALPTLLPEVVVAVRQRVPVWDASAVSADYACGSLFDTCVRVQCSLRNEGDGRGTARVSATILGDAAHERSRAVPLEPGESRIVTFEFPEAQHGESYEDVRCTAETADPAQAW